MPEYIEREALYEKAYWHGELPNVDNPYPDGVEAVDIRDVDEIPAADVVAVVRCRECKYVNPTLDGRLVCGATTNPNWVCSEHFCSYGERIPDQ